jgi:hypothetical protein
MGWTVFNGMPRGGMQAAIDRSLTCSRGVQWSRVLESCVLGGAYYAAVETVDGRERAVIAAVAAIEGSGYKLMDESMNPYYYDCPARILDLLTPAPEAWGGQLGEWSAKWREKCRERLAMEAAS